jgi:hypothetical protein
MSRPAPGPPPTDNPPIEPPPLSKTTTTPPRPDRTPPPADNPLSQPPRPDSRTAPHDGRLAELRRLCLGLPEVSERPSHGAPTWFARDRRAFVTLWEHGHHDNRFPHLWCAAPPGAQHELIASAPDRYFRPPYVGHRGWLGVRLDGDVDWSEIAELCRDAYDAVSTPKKSTSSRP